MYGTNGAWLVDASNATFPSGSWFSANNVAVSYLTAGDQLAMNTLSVTSSKPAITTPYYTNYTDSSDITRAYECTLLITRLVDQKSSSNLGRTKIPSGYPSNTPQFLLTFHKGAATKGYYASKKYTADRVLVDMSVVQAPQLTVD